MHGKNFASQGNLCTRFVVFVSGLLKPSHPNWQISILMISLTFFFENPQHMQTQITFFSRHRSHRHVVVSTRFRSIVLCFSRPVVLPTVWHCRSMFFRFHPGIVTPIIYCVFESWELCCSSLEHMTPSQPSAGSRESCFVVAPFSYGNGFTEPVHLHRHCRKHRHNHNHCLPHWSYLTFPKRLQPCNSLKVLETIQPKHQCACVARRPCVQTCVYK